MMHTIRTLTIENLISGDPVEVQGVKLDAQVSVTVRQDVWSESGHFGSDRFGEAEIESLDVRQVYIYVDSRRDILLLDQESLKTRHKALYEAFLTAIELEALKQAKAAPIESWSVEGGDV